MYEQFMGDFTYRDSASQQVQLFKFLLFNNTQDVNFRATSLLRFLSLSTNSGNETLFLILNICYEHTMLVCVLQQSANVH